MSVKIDFTLNQFSYILNFIINCCEWINNFTILFKLYNIPERKKKLALEMFQQITMKREQIMVINKQILLIKESSRKGEKIKIFRILHKLLGFDSAHVLSR
jgi:hypothetical protein